MNLPVGVFGFIFGALFLKESRESSAGRSMLPASPVLLTVITGISMFVLLVIVELRLSQPMLDLRLYRERMFRNSNIVQAVSFGSMAGLLFLLPQFLQNLRGLSALQSGLTTFPQAIGMMLAIRMVGRLYPRIGPRRLIAGGLVSVTIVSLAFVEVDLSTSLWWIRILMFLRGISMSFAFIPLQAATYANISGANTGRASALYSTHRQVGGALGVAVLATVWLSRTNALTAGVTGTASVRAAQVGGFHDAFLAATFFSIVAAGAHAAGE